MGAEAAFRASARHLILLVATSLTLAACVPAASVRPAALPGASYGQPAPVVPTGSRVNPGVPSGQTVAISQLAAAQRVPTLVRPPVAEATGAGAERAYVTGILRDLQRVSFRENREYCGYIGLNGQNQLMRTEYSRGVEAGCALPQIPGGMRVLASFHTHSTYSPLYASEFPTSQDLASDAQLDVDGYIATPGGRLWYHDSDTMTVRQLCGPGCLPQDPNYDPTDDGPLRASFTFDQLRSFETRGRY